MVAAMRMTLAAVPFLFHVIDIAVRGQLSVTADDAAASERGEAEKPNKVAHNVPLVFRVEQ